MFLRILTAHANSHATSCIERANLVPGAHLSFGQHQDTELWNNQFPESKVLGLPVSKRMRALVYMTSRYKVDVNAFRIDI